MGKKKMTKNLRQGGIGALGDVLLNEKVESAHVVAEGRGPGVPVGFSGSVFALPGGHGSGEFGPLGGLSRTLGIVRGRHVGAGVLDAFPFTENNGIGDFTRGGD